MKENLTFTVWSKKWKEERKNVHTETILKLWQQPLPRHWERQIWEGKLGYRKRSDNKGEQRIERQLFELGSRGVNLEFPDGGKPARVEAVYHNMPLVNQRHGQVIADAFGVLEMDRVCRPLFIEVKTTDNDPWYALVENLQQVRLARACAQRIQHFVHQKTKHRTQFGVWGLVLAPNSYYQKHSRNLSEC